MDAFLSWFYDFIAKMLEGFVTFFGGIFRGIVQVFNIPEYVRIFSEHSSEFSALDWILAIFGVLLVTGIWVFLFYIIFLLIKRRVQVRRAIGNQEELYEEVADLHKEVMRLNEEKDRILSLKISQSGCSAKELAEAITEITQRDTSDESYGPGSVGKTSDTIGDARFFKLSEVDAKYENYIAPAYDTGMNLEQIVENFRNFACSQLDLYYETQTLRFVIAGMASSKMLLLQGISGTGKTSLPYAMGKFFTHDATIASVQPSWRDRTELFGYFNEFTKKFNETEVLKRIYEASYNDDINIIILDEMNIARVEYYFAEMLSILEMPDISEWKLDLVPSAWPNDPKHLEHGTLHIPENLWYIGTANNDDSTFSISDKVYDRALTINLDAKGAQFEAPPTAPMNISFSYLESLYAEAWQKHPISKENLDKIAKLDIFIIQKLRIAFGNRIMKQLLEFVPVFVACGGTELEAVDYILSTKVFRKFESLNLSLMRDELGELDGYLSKVFGKTSMTLCRAYLEYLKNLY